MSNKYIPQEISYTDVEGNGKHVPNESGLYVCPILRR